MSIQTKGHKENQPGLRGHSHDPEQDLMKQYLVLEVLPDNRGRLAVYSHKNALGAMLYILDTKNLEKMFIVVDQFDRDSIIFYDEGFVLGEHDVLSEEESADHMHRLHTIATKTES